MKRITSIILLLFSLAAFSQMETEIFLFDFEVKGDSVLISNGKNISNNSGYDNQPSFAGPNIVIYAGTQNEATDIAAHNIPSAQNFWFNLPTEGGEYSPQLMPGGKAAAAVRLDPDGLQRLYSYPIPKAESSMLVEDLKVAYFTFYDASAIACSVIEEDGLDFGIYNLEELRFYKLAKNAGRSIHKIPNSNSISYTKKNEGGHFEIRKIAMDNDYHDNLVTALPNDVQDHIWVSEKILLCGKDDKIYRYDLDTSKEWTEVTHLKKEKLKNISRMAINSNGNYLALAAETDALTPSEVVQKQVDSYNANDLDAFVNCYSEDVWVSRFPTDTLYVGRKQMRENYGSYLESVESTEVKVTTRIAIGSTVIDQELATDNGLQSHQVAIYTVKNGEITSMNFIFDKETEDPEPIVQKQLDAYNNRDIGAFLATYSDDIKLLNYPHSVTSEGQQAMRKGYAGFFESTLDLHCEIKNRIVIGNKVIDEEYITANGGNFSAVAIYEVKNGKIARVTFLQ